jgi:drug/metabolite transporter (DMT)-like permease
LSSTARLGPQAFVTLLLLASMFGANHVAARVALDHGVDVATAVAVRSLATAAVVALIVWANRVPLVLQPRHRRVMPVIGLLVAVQSACLYSAVARIPVGLALLAFNTYPLWTAAAVWVLYRHRPERAVLIAKPVILVGLALALDVSGAAAGLDARAQWSRIGAGVGFAVVAAAVFGIVLALTQHAPAGWWGLALLSVFYGTAFTVLFTLLPKLGVVGNSPILNVEPVAALGLGWLVLGQRVAAVQVLGAFVVVGAVTALGLRRR